MCACRGTAGFAHESCLAEQAKILMEEVEENNLGWEVMHERWQRWHKCGLCEQDYHGVVRCALGWACWKTYRGRPEEDVPRRGAMRLLGNGLYAAKHYEGALSAWEAELAMQRRLGSSEGETLIVQGNLASTYQELGRPESALLMQRDVYHGTSKLNGEEDGETLREASNYAAALIGLNHFKEAMSFLRRQIPVARRVLGLEHDLTLRFRDEYAQCLYQDPSASREDVAEAVAIFEDVYRRTRRIFGDGHPNWASVQ